MIMHTHSNLFLLKYFSCDLSKHKTNIHIYVTLRLKTIKKS